MLILNRLNLNHYTQSDTHSRILKLLNGPHTVIQGILAHPSFRLPRIHHSSLLPFLTSCLPTFLPFTIMNSFTYQYIQYTSLHMPTNKPYCPFRLSCHMTQFFSFLVADYLVKIVV